MSGPRLSHAPVVRQTKLVFRISGLAFGDDDGDVVLLFVRAMAAYLVDDGRDQCLRGQVGVALQAIDEALFAEFHPVSVSGLGDAIGVKGEDIAGEESGLADRAVPVAE